MKSLFKPILTIAAMATLVFGVAACTTDSNGITAGLSSDQTIAYSTYMAGAFMADSQETAEEGTTSNDSSVMNLATGTEEEAMLAIEEELGEVNDYFERLKVFLDNGMENPFTIDQDLDVEGDWDITMGYTVEGKDYTILLNEDSEGTLTGTLIIDGVEYDVEGYRETESETEDEDENDADEEEDEDSDDETNTDDEADVEEDTDTEDDQETDTEENTEEAVVTETEEEIYLKTIDKENSDNYIEITIETEQEDEENEFEMKLESLIDGVEKDMKIEFEVENDEVSIEMETQDGNKYEFARETENDNDDIEYEFEYTVDGVEGEVELIVTTNEAGEEIYRYHIEEDGEEKDVEFDDDDDDDDDDEDEDSEEDTDNEESTDDEETTTA